MPRGRTPKPTRLKILQGTFRPDRAQSDEMSVPIGTPSAPDVLNKTALAEWERLVPILSASRVLTEADRGTLASYCMAWARWVEAEKILTSKGMTTTSPKGYEMQRPEVSIASNAQKAMERLASHLGLSPAARTRVKAGPPVNKENPFAMFGKPPRR
jgi:P27 family predicted phage terminase small subunit